MSLRGYLQHLDEQGKLIHIKDPISKIFEIAGVLKKLEPRPVLFENVQESELRVVGNLFCSKSAFADYFGILPQNIISSLIKATNHHRPPSRFEIDAKKGDVAPCQEVVNSDPDLHELPILYHCEGDGGNYISSGVFLARHPAHGQNADFHRAMQFSKNQMAIRVVKGRHFDTYLERQKIMDVAVCVGLPPNILAAAATSVGLGVDELEIANAMEPFRLCVR
jgi:2,5-furandicarboxylate decarboxylase 1